MRISLRPVCFLVLIAACGSASVVAQAPPTPDLTITTHEVLLDVVVTDLDGHTVPGLTAADFSISEDGQPQSIRHLEAHTAISAVERAKLASTPALPPNTFTNFTPFAGSNAYTVILLDQLDMKTDAEMYLRQQLIEYLKQMQPGTPAAIFRLDTELHLVQGFTTDSAALLAAAESKRDALSLVKPTEGSHYGNIRERNDYLRAAMQRLGRYLAGLPGRKNLIWLTGSVPTLSDYVSPMKYGTSSPQPKILNSPQAKVGIIHGSDDNSQIAPAENDVADSTNSYFPDSFNVSSDGTAGMIDQLSLSRVAIYPVDVRGLDTMLPKIATKGAIVNNGDVPTSSKNHLVLDKIAEATGGKAYYNTNSIPGALNEIISDGSNYYTLSYTTTNRKWNGKYRCIKITLARPGLRLQYRAGYYAVDRTQQERRQIADLTGSSAATEAAPAFSQHSGEVFKEAMILGAVPATEIVFSAHVTMEDATATPDKNAALPASNHLAESYRTKPFRNIDLITRTDAHSLELARTPDGKRHGSLELAMFLYTPDGDMVNSMMRSVNFSLTEDAYRRVLSEGLPLKEQIAVPLKGEYFLRIGVHDPGNDRIGTVEIPVDQVRAGIAPPAAGGTN